MRLDRTTTGRDPASLVKRSCLRNSVLDSARSSIRADAKVCFDFIGIHIFYLDQVKVFAKCESKET